jgi:integrase
MTTRGTSRSRMYRGQPLPRNVHHVVYPSGREAFILDRGTGQDRIYKTFATHKEMKDFVGLLDHATHRAELGLSASVVPIELPSLMAKYRERKVLSAADRAEQAFEVLLDFYQVTFSAQPLVHQITTDQMCEFIKYLERPYLSKPYMVKTREWGKVVEKEVRQRRKRERDGGVLRIMEVIRALLNCALEWGHFPREVPNPAAQAMRMMDVGKSDDASGDDKRDARSERAGEKNFWVASQIDRILERLDHLGEGIKSGMDAPDDPQDLKDRIMFLIATGCRPCEMARVTLGDIDWGRWQVCLRTAKQRKKSRRRRKRHRHVPLSEQAMQMVASRIQRLFPEAAERVDLEINARPLFGECPNLRQRLVRVLKTIKLTGTPYTCRHTWFTQLLTAGLPPHVLAGLGGNSEQVIRDHYGHHIPITSAEWQTLHPLIADPRVHHAAPRTSSLDFTQMQQRQSAA